MTDIRRAVRRVTVEDGVDIPLTLVSGALNERSIPLGQFIPVSIGANYVTYDVIFIYPDSTNPLPIEFTIISNLISDGEDIDEQLISDINAFGATDTHTRYIARNKVVINLLIVTATG